MNIYIKTIFEVFSKKKNLYLLIGLYAFRYLFASTIPLGSDEAYYWDWGRNVQLSFYDHPPFVAWISWLSQQILPGKSFLQARLLVPFIHFLTNLNLIFIARILNNKKLDNFQTSLLILATQIAPIMNLGSFMLVPDISLIYCISSYFSICAYYLIHKKNKVPLVGTLFIGLFAGLAFTSKYHAIAMVGSSALYLLVAARKFRSISFILIFSLVFLFAASPVLVWNYHHDFISLGFQMRHGFSSPSFNPIWGGRIIVAEFLLCTPVVILSLGQILTKHYSKPIVGLLASGSLPLLLLFLITSFFKEVLPHWPLPCIIILSPILVLTKPAIKSRWFQFNFIYSSVLVSILALCLGVRAIRHQIPKLMNARPGGLGEITLWDQLLPELDKHKIWYKSENNIASYCPETPLIGSFRWFWVAQLALHAPLNTKVLSFDQNHLSYYNFRDNKLNLRGCQVILIGEAGHVNLNKLRELVSITREENILIPDHQDRPIKIIWGQVIKNNIPLNNLQLSLSKN